MQVWMALAVVCLVATSLFAAAPQTFVNGSQQWERNRIVRLEQSLNFTSVAMPTPWMITILPEGEFDYERDRFHLDTTTAFTVMQQQHTFLNEGALIWAGDDKVRHTIAHEAGHLICECSSEDKANDIARRLEQ